LKDCLLAGNIATAVATATEILQSLSDPLNSQLLSDLGRMSTEL
jgi:hypothetical protein